MPAPIAKHPAPAVSRREFISRSGATLAVAGLVGTVTTMGHLLAADAPAPTTPLPMNPETQGNTLMPLTLPDLPYAYNALEPFIDEATMKLHHDKHHATYLQKYVDGVKGSEFENLPPEQVLAALDKVPANLRGVVRNHGGGYINHNLFWTIMGPKAGGAPGGQLGEAVAKTFTAFDTFKTQFSAAATGIFGSGWAWLVVKKDGTLAITTTPNQDTPLSIGDTPVLTLDVWEHAYYLKYQNRRAEYIAAWWNVVNWNVVADKYAQARKG